MMDKMNEVRKGIQAKYQPKLKEALTAEQLQRAQQIAWQAAGSAALADEELTKQLAVTKEQQDKIAAINKEFGDKQRELFAAGFGGGGGGAGGAGGDVRAKMTELNKERDAKTNEVLSKEQQEKFTTLKGKPFDLSQLQQGGPGGGGPGGRPGAGGRPQRGQPKDGDKK